MTAGTRPCRLLPQRSVTTTTPQGSSRGHRQAAARDINSWTMLFLDGVGAVAVVHERNFTSAATVTLVLALVAALVIPALGTPWPVTVFVPSVLGAAAFVMRLFSREYKICVTPRSGHRSDCIELACVDGESAREAATMIRNALRERDRRRDRRGAAQGSV